MKKSILLTVILLSLFPILNICDYTSISAQSWAYENGSYWLPEVIVDSKNERCTVCDKIYDPEEGHDCQTKCEYCDTYISDLDYHYITNLSCANAAGYGSEGDSGEYDNSSADEIDDDVSEEGNILPEVVVVGSNSSGSNDSWFDVIIVDGNDDNSEVSEDSLAQGLADVSDTTTVGSLPTSGRISIKNLLLLAVTEGVRIARLDMPEKFHSQNLKYECVVRGLANVSQILGKDYDVAYNTLLDIAKTAGYNLNERGILDRNIQMLFNDFVTLSKHECTQNFIENQINAYKNVLVTIWTEDGPHMVTILAYDNNYYYCAAGYEDVDIIQKELIDTSRSAYVVLQFNGVYK